MKASLLPTRAVVLGVAAVCALLVGLAQSADAGTKLRGKRDISGLWLNFPFALSFDPSVKRGEPQKVVLQPEYDARYKARQAAIAKGEAEGKPVVDTLTLCIPVGMPGAMHAFFPMEFAVTKKTIYVFPEGVDPPRRIFMDGRSIPSLDVLEPTFAGYSVGRWEGNTLVVDTAGVKTSTLLDGIPHSDAMRFNERMRLLDDDTLEIAYIITDPKAFKAPWVVTKQFKAYNTMAMIGMGGRPPKDPGTYPDYKGAPLVAMETVCNENNRNLPGADGVVGAKLGGK
jgi:hypothetical protein